MNRLWILALTVLALCACENEDEGVTSVNSDGGTVDMGVAADRGVVDRMDGSAPLAIDTVSGDLTYVTVDDDGGQIYSVQVDGRVRQRISPFGAAWGYHAVGPDPRFVAAVQHAETLESGAPDPASPGEVWVIDVRNREAHRASPEGCNSGIGGVGWLSDSVLMFAMSCGDEPAKAYKASATTVDPTPELLLAVSPNEEPVRDVFPAVNTSIYTYVVEVEKCEGDECVVKNQVWLGDAEVSLNCLVTEGDRFFRSGAEFSGPVQRIGDHNPSFTRDLTALVFSRNVGGKPAGPEGHHDLMRIGLNLNYFFDGQMYCDQTGTTANLSNNFIDERYANAEGAQVQGHERHPQSAAGGRAPAGTILYSGQTYSPAGTTSVIWLVDVDGSRRAVTPEDRWSGYARWVVEDYMLSGTR